LYTKGGKENEKELCKKQSRHLTPTLYFRYPCAARGEKVERYGGCEHTKTERVAWTDKLGLVPLQDMAVTLLEYLFFEVF